MGFLKGGSLLLLCKEWANSLTCVWKAKALRGIQPEKEFHGTLERERARADRNGEEFSLVVFGINRRSDEVVPLATALAGRVRSTDILGWRDGELSVLLPDTPPAGAWKLADEIRQKMLAVSLPVNCTVFGYPFQNWNGTDSRNGTGHMILIDSCPK